MCGIEDPDELEMDFLFTTTSSTVTVKPNEK